MQNENYGAFAEAYNNFDSCPLKGESLKKFFSDDLHRHIIEKIVTTTEQHKNILITGHIGCGKSTILNRIAELLKDKYHTTAFSASDELNMMDVETTDILITIYLQLIRSVKDKIPEHLLKSFGQIMKPVREQLNINTKDPLKLLESVSLKIRTEQESRKIVRSIFKAHVKMLRQNISKTCDEISGHVKKEVLIIADDLDKLNNELTEKIFFGEYSLPDMSEIRIIFAFPLAAYHSPSYVRIADKFASEFVPLVHLRDIEGKYQKESLVMLMKLVLKRIDRKLISVEALKYLVEKSGGLLNDLMKSVQDVCKIAITRQAPVIDEDISKNAIQYRINEFERLFDFPMYEKQVRKIIKTRGSDEIANEHMSYLLQNLFVLKYGPGNDQSWYSAHPCLRECFKEQG